MSFDLNLIAVCDHWMYKEEVSLESDLKTIRLSRPLAAASVELMASDDIVPTADYIIVYDTSAEDPEFSRLIKFKKKWHSPEDYFQISYYTIKDWCPKCAGLDVINDISYNVRGGLLEVRNEKLLLQNLEKFVVTEAGSNPFHNYIGTSIISYLGEKVSDENFISTKITAEISTTLGALKSMQEQYVKTGRSVTDGELLDRVGNIIVNFDTKDPTILYAEVVCRAKSGKSVDYTQTLKIA